LWSNWVPDEANKLDFQRNEKNATKHTVQNDMPKDPVRFMMVKIPFKMGNFLLQVIPIGQSG
jgi:hypothetical protein